MSAQAAISTADEPEPVRQPAAAEPPEEAIRRLSRQIWEREGRPEGYAEEHWARARAELAEQLARMANAHLATRCPAPAPEEHIAPPDQLVRSIVSHLPPQLPKTRRSDEAVSDIAWLLEAKRPDNTAPSIIHGGLLLRGDLDSPGDLHFDGRLEGNVRSASLDVGKDAVIQGEVVAGELIVRGTIRGCICANKILLCAGARIEGEILYRTLAIETGSQLDARFHQLQADLQEI